MGSCRPPPQLTLTFDSPRALRADAGWPLLMPCRWKAARWTALPLLCLPSVRAVLAEEVGADGRFLPTGNFRPTRGVYVDRRWVRVFFVVSHPAAPDPRIDETSILCRP